jgi:ParB family transcriptional regulator, chromosome partitioning protein
MASKKGLGRGLSALIPPPPPPVTRVEAVASEVDDASNAPLFIAISRIAPNPGQPRKIFRESELATLAASIREQGVLQPLVVRKRGDGYELIIGERRWRAAQLAGLDEVPAVVLDATDRQVVEMALVENVQRADLNPMELAEAFRVLIDDEGMTQEEAGRRVGLDRSSVANHLRLLELSREIQQDLIDQRLTMGHAKAILQVPVEQRIMVRDQIIRSALSVRSAEELSRRAASSAPRQARPGPVRDVHVADLEEQLRKSLQTKVRIIGRRARGRIELHYFGEGELERLSDHLLGETS